MSKKICAIYLLILVLATAALLMRASKDHDTDLSHSFHPDDSGEILQSDYYSMWPGDYTVTMEYEAAEDTEIRLRLNKDGDPYPAVLPPEESLFQFPMHLEDYTDTLHFEYDLSHQDVFTVKRIHLSSEGLLYTDSLFEGILFFLTGLAILLYLRSKRFREKTRAEKGMILVMALCVIFSSIPFFRTDLHFGWDNYAHRSRLDGIMQALFNHEFPVVIYPDKCNGFGILGMVYPQLPLYVPAIFRMLHVSAPVCISFVFIVNNVCAALFSYICGMVVFHRDCKKAFLFTVLFTLAPYRLIDMYNRCALGEVIAISFVPLIIAALYLITSEQIEDKRTGFLAVILMTAGMSGVINSHILSIMYCTIFIALFVLSSIRRFLRWRPWCVLMESAFFVFLVCIGFLIPFLKFYFDGLSNESVEHDSFEGYAGLLDIFRNFDFSTGLIYTNLSWIGAVLFILSVIAVAVKIRNKKWEGDDRFMLTSLIISICFVITAVKEFPWDFLRAHSSVILKMTSVAEFRFRIMLVAVPLFLLASLYFVLDSEMVQPFAKYLVPGICLLSLISILPGFVGEMKDGVMYTKMSGGASEDISWEYRPKGVHSEHYQNPQLFWSDEDLVIEGYDKDGIRIHFRYTAERDGSYADVPLLYYYGYGASAVGQDGKKHKLAIGRGDEYRVRIFLPKEYSGSEVDFSYRGFRLIYLIEGLSMLAFAACLAWFLFSARGRIDDVPES